jgi:hypothetical protein
MKGRREVAIPAFRHYSSKMDAVGNVALFVSSNLDEAAIGELIAKGRFIDGDEVAKWSKKLPIVLCDDDVRGLVTALNFMLATVHAQHGAVPLFHLESAHRRAERSIAELVKELPRILEFGRKHGSAETLSGVAIFENLLAASESANNYLKASRARFGGESTKPQRRSASWHGDAIYLRWLLEEAGKRAGKSMSFTKPDAPAVEFIDTALTRAQVNHGSPASIAREMARYKAEIDRCKATLSARV